MQSQPERAPVVHIRGFLPINSLLIHQFATIFICSARRGSITYRHKEATADKRVGNLEKPICTITNHIEQSLIGYRLHCSRRGNRLFFLFLSFRP